MGQSCRNPTETDTLRLSHFSSGQGWITSLFLALCLLDFPLGSWARGKKEGAHINYLSKSCDFCFLVQFFTQTDVGCWWGPSEKPTETNLWYIYKQKWVQMQMERSNSSEPSIPENTTAGDMLSYKRRAGSKAMSLRNTGAIFPK